MKEQRLLQKKEYQLKYQLKVKSADAACISTCMLLQPSYCHELASPAGMQATQQLGAAA